MIRFPASVRINLALVVLAAVLPMLAVILYGGWELRQGEVDHARMTTLRLADSMARQQEDLAERIRGVLGHLVQSREVRERDLPACDRLFRLALGLAPGAVNFALVDANGDALASALPFSSQNLSERKEVRQVLATGLFSVGEFTVGKVSGVRVLPFASPVRGQRGEVAGVLLATWRMEGDAVLFDQAHLPEGSFVGLVDAAGQRLFRHPAQPQAPPGQQIRADIWDKIRSARETALFTATSSDGVRRVFAVRRVSLDGGEPYLNVFVAIPEDKVLLRADQATRNVLWAFAASLTASVLLAVLAGRYGLHARIARLVQVAGRLGAGELSARSGLTEEQGSLGQLARAMDAMAQALETDRAELVRAREERDREARRLASIVDLSGDGLVLIDKDHRVVEANKRFCEMLGYGLEEVVGLFTWEYEALSSEADIRAAFPMPLGINRIIETAHRGKDGSIRPVEVNIVGDLVNGKPAFLCVVRDITARRQAEEVRRDALLVLRTIMDAIPAEVYAMDPATHEILFMNKRMQERFGGDMLGKPCWSALRHLPAPCPECPVQTLQAPDAPATVTREERDPATGIVRVNLDSLIRWTDGRTVKLQVSTDVTQTRQAEEALMAGERRFRAIFEQAAVGICQTHLDGRFLRANRKFCEILGYGEQELLTMGTEDLTYPDDLEPSRENVRKLLREGSGSLEKRYIRKDGAVIWARVTVNLVQAQDGSPPYCIGFVEDTTRRHQDEENMRAAAGIIRRSLEEKTVLLKEIHHRVKNNLQIITSLLSLQESGTANPEAAQVLRDCQGRVMSMALIHEQLYQSLDFARISAPRYIRQLLDRVRAACRGSADVQVALDVGNFALALDQAIPFGLILNELATNAFKHAFVGRGRGVLRVEARAEAGTVTVTVEDDGVGLPPGLDVEALTSLGLQIVPVLVRQLGGTLAVESAGGTRYTIAFPLRQDAGDESGT